MKNLVNFLPLIGVILFAILACNTFYQATRGMYDQPIPVTTGPQPVMVATMEAQQATIAHQGVSIRAGILLNMMLLIIIGGLVRFIVRIHP